MSAIVPLNNKSRETVPVLLTEHGFRVVDSSIAYRSPILRRMRFVKTGKLFKPYFSVRIVVPERNSTGRDVLDALEGIELNAMPIFQLNPPPGGWAFVFARAVAALTAVFFLYAMMNGIALPMLMHAKTWALMDEKSANDLDDLQNMLKEHGFKIPKPIHLPPLNEAMKPLGDPST